MGGNTVFYQTLMMIDFRSMTVGVHKVHYCSVAYAIGEHGSRNNRPFGVVVACRGEV